MIAAAGLGVQARPAPCASLACRPVACRATRPASDFAKAAKERDGSKEEQMIAERAKSSPLKSVEEGRKAYMPGEVRYEPSESVLNTWRNASAVCFDMDLTLTTKDGIDALAEFKGLGHVIEELTNRAMEGKIDLADSIEARMRLLDPTPEDIRAFLTRHDPESRLVPGAKELIKALLARGIDVYVISGGFRELCMPVARHLGIKPSNVIANRMYFTYDDNDDSDDARPSKFAGFDLQQPTAHQGGKPRAIEVMRQKHPYENIVMIGDGVTDLEAVQVSGAADMFIGYGGVAQRKAVMEGADWFVTDYRQLLDALVKYRVAFVGSGAWACAALTLATRNAREFDPADEFVDEVVVWVHEEDFEGRKLSEVVNETKMNPKYFPGYHLGDNIRATPSLEEAVTGADLLVFVAPHQFIHTICKQIRDVVKPTARALSLIKGMRVRQEGPQLISEMIRKTLNIDCCVMMGANIAGDIASRELSESTLGYTDLESARIWQKLFETPDFIVQLNPDVAGTEISGTLKNVVALAAGFVDGLGLGPNTKAAILRAGLDEMRRFAKAQYPSVRDETFLLSCGFSDLVASSYGGRNRLVAMEWTKRQVSGQPATFNELEEELLKGQKLQGVLTSDEVQAVLDHNMMSHEYPLFTTVNLIVHGHVPVQEILHYKQVGHDEGLKRVQKALKVRVDGDADPSEAPLN